MLSLFFNELSVQSDQLLDFTRCGSSSSEME